MEGIVKEFRSFGKNVSANAFEVHIVKLHVDEKLLIGDGPRPHIDPVGWGPLIMNFCRFFGLSGEVHPSRLVGSDFMKLVTQGTTSQYRASAAVSVLAANMPRRDCWTRRRAFLPRHTAQ